MDIVNYSALNVLNFTECLFIKRNKKPMRNVWISAEINLIISVKMAQKMCVDEWKSSFVFF